MGYGSSNQSLWERSCARKYLFGNIKVCRGKVYLWTMSLPETARNSSPLWFFLKFFPGSFGIISDFLIIIIPFAGCLPSAKSGGWAHVIPTPGFQNEKAVCYFMFLWLWPKQQSLTNVSSEITGYRVTKKTLFGVDLPCSISDVAIRLWRQRPSGRSWETVKK